MPIYDSPFFYMLPFLWVQEKEKRKTVKVKKTETRKDDERKIEKKVSREYLD